MTFFVQLVNKMYLSRVEIDIKNHLLMKKLTHLGAYHNWVEQSFPDEVESLTRTRKLWRIDTINDKKYLLIISENKPSLEKLEEFGVMNTAESKSYDAFLNNLKQGDKLNFRSVLNPVKSTSSGSASGKRGRVFPQVTVEQQLDYFEKKSIKYGFKVNRGDVKIVGRQFLPLKRHNRNIRVSVVEYQGYLEITDLDLFLIALKEGIGSKKAYGCGLLTVIPI